MTIFKIILSAVSLVASMFTMAASAIAIYLFWTKRKDLSTAFQLLLSWSFQTTLAELKGKLERLNEYNANEDADVSEICNILHEIAGQIRGNPKLLIVAPLLAERLESLAMKNRLTEPRKRSMVSEIREVIKNIQVNAVSTNTQGV
jgi:hypothetical protein